jgi:hypothetical protein
MDKFPWNNGSMRCQCVLGGGQRLQYLCLYWFNAVSLHLFSYSIVFEQCLSKTRSVLPREPICGSKTPKNKEEHWLLTGMGCIVLAISNHISLLWSYVTGLVISCFLPSAIFATARRVRRQVSCALFLAADFRNQHTSCPFALFVYAFLRERAFKYVGVYLVATKPRNST